MVGFPKNQNTLYAPRIGPFLAYVNIHTATQVSRDQVWTFVSQVLLHKLDNYNYQGHFPGGITEHDSLSEKEAWLCGIRLFVTYLAVTEGTM
jgi:hypothetical protein